jgi:hypothetical protein
VEALKSARDLNGSNVKREEMGTFGWPRTFRLRKRTEIQHSGSEVNVEEDFKLIYKFESDFNPKTMNSKVLRGNF